MIRYTTPVYMFIYAYNYTYYNNLNNICNYPTALQLVLSDVGTRLRSYSLALRLDTNHCDIS